MEEKIESVENNYDVIVIGAGAAGMMAAGTAAKNGKRVLLLEKMEKSGRKVRISGRGRCNVTNARPVEEFAEHVRANAEFFMPAFEAFNNRTTMKFFERMGCKLETERGERVFPKSGKAWDIANALLDFCVDNHVKIMYDTPVSEVLAVGGRVYGVKYINKRGFARKEEAAQIIIATGGVSYPATGSTGDGYTFAADLGHDVEPVRPSLTPLISDHPHFKRLEGLSLRNTNAKLFIDGELVREEFGEIAFSDRGIEGPIALRLSRNGVDALIDERDVKLCLDLKPALTEEVLRERIAREVESMEPTEILGELLRRLVPKYLVIPIAEHMGLYSSVYINKVTQDQFEVMISTLKNFELNIVDYAPFEFAIVTAGGVSCDDVDEQTMQSRKIKGLYFAGEVLDLDADTGGYNLQIAFSTGRLAGMLKE
ncbi:MAG: NAD(P)/FAD-dependent oxidoreductase [Rikenellaceae bacterium]